MIIVDKAVKTVDNDHCFTGMPAETIAGSSLYGTQVLIEPSGPKNPEPPMTREQKLEELGYRLAFVGLRLWLSALTPAAIYGIFAFLAANPNPFEWEFVVRVLLTAFGVGGFLVSLPAWGDFLRRYL